MLYFLLYGSKAWTIKKNDTKKAESFEIYCFI